MRKLWFKLPVVLQAFLVVVLLFFVVGFMGPYLISSGSTFLAIFGGVAVFLGLWFAVVLTKWTCYDAFQIGDHS